MNYAESEASQRPDCLKRGRERSDSITVREAPSSGLVGASTKRLHRWTSGGRFFFFLAPSEMELLQ